MVIYYLKAWKVVNWFGPKKKERESCELVVSYGFRLTTDWNRDFALHRHRNVNFKLNCSFKKWQCYFTFTQIMQIDACTNKMSWVQINCLI